MREGGREAGRLAQSMDVVNQPSASPFAGLVLESARGSSIETPSPPPHPPHPVQIIKRSVSSAAADTVDGWWRLRTGVLWPAATRGGVGEGDGWGG